MDKRRIFGVILGLLGLFYVIPMSEIHQAARLDFGLSYQALAPMGAVFLVVGALLLWHGEHE